VGGYLTLTHACVRDLEFSFVIFAFVLLSLLAFSDCIFCVYRRFRFMSGWREGMIQMGWSCRATPCHAEVSWTVGCN
jgi:hypothetical protein